MSSETDTTGENEIKMSRREKRDRLRFFKKEYDKHLKTKPKISSSIDLSDEDAVKQNNNIRQWLVRKINLEKKITELSHGNKKYNRRTKKFGEG